MRHTAIPLNTWDLAKILGLLLMFVDHSGAFIFTHPADDYWLRAVGRGAAPIFLFLAGFASSYRFSREIFLLALALTVSDTLLAGHLREQNILFTILGCRLIFDWFEKRGRKIERPFEWVFGAVALFMTMFAVQYGSIGFLFALAGYVRRRPHEYSRGVREALLILACIIYGAFELGFSDPPISAGMTIITLSCVYLLLSRLEIREVRAPSWLKQPLKLAARYSLYIYVVHLIALEWMTGIPI